MDSENSKTSDPHRLLVNLSDKINLKRSDKYVALSNLSIYYTWQITKKVTQRQQISCDVEWRIWIAWWIKFLYQIFEIILNIS